MTQVDELIAEHEAAGRYFEAAGVRSFVREEGSGPAVVLVHGVPVSSYLYRRVIPLLAGRGFRAIAFDLPGLGLAERPEHFDYSWSGLARFMEAALDELGVERCHLVLHDIGGPIGVEVAIRRPEQVETMTVLDTLLDVGSYRGPPAYVMRPFAVPGLGRLYLRATPRPIFTQLYYWQGIKDRAAVPRSEVHAHYDLLLRGDNGAAFLKIMRGFELGKDKERYFREGLAADRRPYPAQVVWGEDDPALGRKRRLAAQEFLGVTTPTLLPGKHFFQEDQAEALAQAIGSFASGAGSGS